MTSAYTANARCPDIIEIMNIKPIFLSMKCGKYIESC
jgi:hypothetical protein